MAERYGNYVQCGDGELIDRLRRGETGIMDYICEKYKNLVRSKAKSMFYTGGGQRGSDPGRDDRSV